MKFIKTWLHADLPLQSEGQTRTPEDKRSIFGAKQLTPEDRGLPWRTEATPRRTAGTPDDSATQICRGL